TDVAGLEARGARVRPVGRLHGPHPAAVRAAPAPGCVAVAQGHPAPGRVDALRARRGPGDRARRTRRERCAAVPARVGDRAAGWPEVTSYPSLAELSAALGAPLAARIGLLDPQARFGYVRDWQPPGMAPLRHLAYAIQWWSFAVLALVVWAIMSTRRNHAAASG